MKRILFSLFLAAGMPVASALAEAPIQPGDHVAIVGNTFADQIRIHGYLETLLLQRTAQNPVSIRNLGWAGDMLSLRDRPTNFPTEESTLTDHQTDVIIGCFGLGESFEGEEGIEGFKQDLVDFVTTHRGQKYNGKKPVRLVLISPIAHEDIGRLTEMAEKRNGQLEAYTDAMAAVAVEQGVPFVDLFTPMKYIMEEPEAPQLTTNGIHLNSYGYWAAARFMFDKLVVGEGETVREQPWRVTIDAKKGSGSAEGLSLEKVESSDKGISFVATEKFGPTLAPPTSEALPPQLAEYRDTLMVEKLAPGNYELIIDGEKVVSASASEWSQGVPIDSSPAHAEAEALRKAVLDKNNQFTYSWKAYNQVHIVGERRSSPAGQALPGEVIEFNQLADKRDAELREGIALKTRQWRLTRVGQ
tara:strand:+ start:218 stop:1462 length:1245 start_codon:yes stop_codon:yes gene_type:complete